MPFPSKVKQLILAMGILQLQGTEIVRTTTSHISAGDDSFFKHPELHSEDSSEIQTRKQMDLLKNTSVTEDDMKQGKFCVKMNALQAGDVLSARQLITLSCLYEYVMSTPSQDGSGLLFCLSQAGRYT